MSGTTCPKCGSAVAADDVFCPACDCVLDVEQVLFEAEGTAEIDLLAMDDGDGEEVVFDPETDGADSAESGGSEASDSGGFARARLDDDLAAELAQVLEDGTGTVDLPSDSPDGDGVLFDADAPLDADGLFEDPPMSGEGDPVPPPGFEEGSGSYSGEALILGDVAASGADFESMLSDATGAFTLEGCAVEPAPIYVAQSVQQLTAPTAVLATKGDLPRMLPQLSPFERHVVQLVDGRRTVLRIAKKAGLSLSDTVVALGLLADRGLLELVGHAKLKGAPRPAPDAPPPSTARALNPFGDDLALEDPPAPMELPLDALTPLELPADALTPLPPQPTSPAPSRSPSPSPPSPEPRRTSSPFDDEEVAVRPAAPVGGVRPALSLKPATVSTAPRAGLVVRDEPTASAPPPRPRAGLTVRDLASPSAPAAPAAPQRAAAPTVTTAKRVDPVVHARAMQLIEVALKELREGRKVTALAWVKMAAELVPGDPKIESLLASWNGTPSKIVEDAAVSGGPPPSEDQQLAAQARSLEAAGDAQGAANAYRRALKLKPSDPELYNRLGIVLAVRLKDFIGATAALKKALEYAPTNLAYRSNLGKVVKMAAGEKLADEALYGGDESHKIKPTSEDKPSSFLDRLKGMRKR